VVRTGSVTVRIKSKAAQIEGSVGSGRFQGVLHTQSTRILEGKENQLWTLFQKQPPMLSRTIDGGGRSYEEHYELGTAGS
jgi:hypothetical protein